MPIEGDIPLLTLMRNSTRPERQVSELVFLAGQPKYFSDKTELLYEIKEAIASRYKVPIHQILICGSAHLGCSVHKDQNFVAGSSDLDLAIISPALFSWFHAKVIEITNSFTDLRRFGRRDGISTKDEFVRYVAERGMIRPDMLPRTDIKTEWFDFFDELSSRYPSHFKKISAAIYLSETCFTAKQVPAVIHARRGAA
jgi:hypothetical protein